MSESRTSHADIPRVLDHLAAGRDGALTRLFQFLSIPSISTDPAYHAACIEAAEWCASELRDIGFLVFSRAVTARGTHTMFSGRKTDVQVSVPVSCGGIVVHPGDVIVGDEIGITVIPAADLEKVLAAAREQAQREEATRQRIRQGKTFEELLAEFGRI